VSGQLAAALADGAAWKATASSGVTVTPSELSSSTQRLGRVSATPLITSRDLAPRPLGSLATTAAAVMSAGSWTITASGGPAWSAADPESSPAAARVAPGSAPGWLFGGLAAAQAGVTASTESPPAAAAATQRVLRRPQDTPRLLFMER
jgi:hypothetical protein